MYDAAWNTGYFTNYLSSTYAEFGIPIWLTEFAGSGTVAEQQTFFKYYLPWLEAQPFIFRYAAFGESVLVRRTLSWPLLTISLVLQARSRVLSSMRMDP